MVATLVSPLAHLSRRAVPRAHARAPAARRPRRAAARARADRPAAAAACCSAPGLRWLRVFAHPVVALVAWAANFYLWHLPALYQGAVEHDAVHALQHILFVSFGIGDVDGAARPAARSPRGSATAAKIGYIVAVRLIQSVLANALLWSSGVLYPRYAAGEALLGHLARQRPERGGRDHDGRGLDRHDPAVLLAVPARRARERGAARRWSSWPRRAASS